MNLSLEIRTLCDQYPTDIHGGFVYVMSTTSDHRTVKIGSSLTPQARRSALQIGNSDKLRLVATYRCARYSSMEHALQRLFTRYRKSGEWFCFDDGILSELLSHFTLESMMDSPHPASSEPPHEMKDGDSLPEYLKAWIEAKTPNTRRSYLHTIKAFYIHLTSIRPDEAPNLDNVEFPDLTSFIESRKKMGDKPATLRKHAIFLRAIFKFLTKQDVIRRDPSIDLELTSVPRMVSDRLLTKAERQRVMGACVVPVLALILRTLYVSGIQIGECLGLEKTSLKEEPQNGYLKTTISGKGNKLRSIWIPAALGTELLQYCKDRNGKYIFATKMGTALSREQVHRWLLRTLKNAGIDKKVSSHWFRHTHATEALRNGCNIVDLQATLGHSCITTTRMYLHVNDENASSRFIVDD